MRSLHSAVSSFLAACTALIATASVAPASVAPAQASEVRSCWLTQYTFVGKSEPQLRAIAQNIRNGGMNTVYVAMYSGQSTLWPSRAYKAAGGNWASSSIDYARDLCRIFHDEGLQVGAWFEYGLAVGLGSHPLAVAHPDWLARDIGGDPVTSENGGFVFLSPGSQPATDLLVAMVTELAQDYDFDDIQLDRIRWGRKSTGREYGYEAPTAALYFAQYGVNPPSNVNSAQWVTFREGLVNSLMQRSFNAVKSANPTIVVSSAPTGSYGITQHMQRWSSWLAGGYIDLVMPQMYLTSLASFQTEFQTCRTQAGSYLSKLGVGYRASDDTDWSLVQNQLNYARGQGVPHGALWVYHQYTAQIAIQDEIDNLPAPGGPWNASAVNPFVSSRSIQIVGDDADGAATYAETSAGWQSSAQAGAMRFGSRVAPGTAPVSVEWRLAVPRTGTYDVYVWYTAASNRNDTAQYTVHSYDETSVVPIDQRANGSRWIRLGRFLFGQGPSAVRVALTNTGADAAEWTSADAVKLVHAPEGENECATAPNTAGPGMLVGWSGTTSVSANNLVLVAEGGPPNSVGLFYYGAAATQVPFGNGFRCIGGTTWRLGPPQFLDANGNTLRFVNYTSPPMSAGGGAITAGIQRRFQLWYRNAAAGGAGFNLSDAIALTFTP